MNVFAVLACTVAGAISAYDVMIEMDRYRPRIPILFARSAIVFWLFTLSLYFYFHL